MEDVASVRKTLDSRYGDLKSGRVKPIDGKEAFSKLREKSERRRRRSTRLFLIHDTVLISDWPGAGLPKASLIKPVLAAIEQRLILRKLGALNGADVEALRSARANCHAAQA